MANHQVFACALWHSVCNFIGQSSVIHLGKMWNLSVGCHTRHHQAGGLAVRIDAVDNEPSLLMQNFTTENSGSTSAQGLTAFDKLASIRAIPAAVNLLGKCTISRLHRNTATYNPCCCALSFCITVCLFRHRIQSEIAPGPAHDLIHVHQKLCICLACMSSHG